MVVQLAARQHAPPQGLGAQDVPAKNIPVVQSLCRQTDAHEPSAEQQAPAPMTVICATDEIVEGGLKTPSEPALYITQRYVLRLGSVLGHVPVGASAWMLWMVSVAVLVPEYVVPSCGIWQLNELSPSLSTQYASGLAGTLKA